MFQMNGSILKIRKLSVILLGLALFLSFIAGAARAARGEPQGIEPDFAAVDAYIQKQMKEVRIPGVAIAIVHGDQIVHMKGYGIADPAGRPMTAQTPVMLASLAKPMTGVAILQLVEAGKIDLDAPVQRYLPWFRVADESASAQITVRHLLYHTSGLPESAATEYGITGDQRPDALEQQVRELSNITLADPVGKAYHYSNPNYRVLGLIIQQITGQPYEAYMQEHVFAPLEMHQTFTSPEAVGPLALAKGYRYLFGLPLPFNEPFDRGGVASGGIIASAEDVAHFLIANLNEGRYGDTQIVSAPGMAEMQRPAFPVGAEVWAWDWSAIDFNGVAVLTKGGDLASYKTNMILFPEQKWGFVVLINAGDRFAAILRDLRIPGIAIGLASILLGQQPPDLASNLPIVYRLFLALVALVQVTGIFRSGITFWRWSRYPQSRPRGLWRQIWYIGLPLIVNLVWGLVLLVGVPTILGGYPLSFLLYATPDLGYFLIVSGGVALVWGVARTLIAAFVMRQKMTAGRAPTVQPLKA
jgi:CubicO group peptidase (beta-lactamase class C family)